MERGWRERLFSPEKRSGAKNREDLWRKIGEVFSKSYVAGIIRLAVTQKYLRKGSKGYRQKKSLKKLRR